MESKTNLEQSIQEVLGALRKAGYCQSTILLYKSAYGRMLKAATIMHMDTFNDSLAEHFENDSMGIKTGKFCRSRKLLHCSCIKKLREYKEKGYIGWKSYRESKVDKPVTIKFQKIHVEFLEYLNTEGKSNNTIESYRNVSCKFLNFVQKLGCEDLKIVPLELINEFFCELRNTWNPGSFRTAASALRVFLNFAEGGDRLLIAVPDKLLRKKTIIPELTQEEEQAVWHVLKTDAVSLRNKAIMVLVLLTGLRAVDIVNLKLRDIDWKCDAISISQKKTNKPLVLPLLPVIGNAIAKYIINDRPNLDSSYLFLSKNAPHKPLSGHSSCYAIVRSVFFYAKIRLGKKLKGTRLLRHHVASKMLKKGVAVQTISLALGHVNPNSADVYLTTDEKKLRECALNLSMIPMKVGGLQ